LYPEQTATVYTDKNMTYRLCLALLLISLAPEFALGCSTQSGARGSGSNSSGDDDTSAGDDDTSAGDDDTSAGDDDSSADDDDTTASNTDDDDTTPPPAEELHGSAPSQALAVPSFDATNSDGSARGTPDLLGHPTVLWFFPYAGTPV
jgi:hypothetical protein